MASAPPSVVFRRDGAEVKDEWRHPEKALEIEKVFDKKKYIHLWHRLMHGTFDLYPTQVETLKLGSVKQFSEPLARAMVVKETHDAVFDCLNKWDLTDRDVILVVGLTGAGKSTHCNWLAGWHPQLEVIANEDPDDDEESYSITHVKDSRVESGADGFWDPVLDRKKKVCAELPFKTSGSLTTSMTFLPNSLELDDKTLLIDFAGFSDTTCEEVRLGMDLAFRSVLKQAKSVHPLALMDINSMTVGRSTMASPQINKLSRLMPYHGCKLDMQGKILADASTGYYTWLLGATKVNKHFTKGAQKLFKETQEWLQKDKQSLAAQFVKMDAYMDVAGTNEANGKTASEFIKLLLDNTGVKHEGSGELQVQTSDCLNAADAEKFEGNFLTLEFAELAKVRMFDKIDPQRVMGFEQLEAQGANLQKTIPDEDLHVFTREEWEDMIKTMRQRACVMRCWAEEAKRACDVMREEGKTWTESLFPVFEGLAALGQPRIKQMLLQVDSKLMNFQLSQLILLLLVIQRYVNNMKPSCYTWDFDKVTKKLEEVTQDIKVVSQNLGHKNPESVLAANLPVIGVGAAAVGGVGVGAGWATMGVATLVEATGYAGMAIAGGVAAVAVGSVCLLGWGGYRLYTWHSRDSSHIVAELMVESLDSIASASKAAQHLITNLSAQQAEVKALCLSNVE